jgi:hypothetical protein
VTKNPSDSLINIQDINIYKIPQNIAEGIIYGEHRNDINQKVKIDVVESNATWKNIFDDLHRMGFINCYDKSINIIKNFESKKIKHISLTLQGKKLITEADSQSRLFIFSKGLDRLLEGHINILLELFRNGEHELNRISVYEFMFFVSALNQQTCFGIYQDQCRSLINEFRCLSPIQNRAVLTFVENLLSKEVFLQWQNDALRFFAIVKRSIYFQQKGTTLYLRKILR